MNDEDYFFQPRPYARRNEISVIKIYQEINAGRLIAHNCAAGTIVTVEEEKAWLQRLPKLPSQSDLTSKVDRVDCGSVSVSSMRRDGAELNGALEQTKGGTQ